MKEQKQFDDSKYRWDIIGMKWIKYIWIAIVIIVVGFLIVFMFCE